MKFRPEVDNVYYQVWERVTLEKLMSKSDENYQKQVHLKLMNVVRQLYLNLGGGKWTKFIELIRYALHSTMIKTKRWIMSAKRGLKTLLVRD